MEKQSIDDEKTPMKKQMKKQRNSTETHVTDTANAQSFEERELARVRALGLARWFSGPAMQHVEKWKPD